MGMKKIKDRVIPKHRPMFDITKVPTWYYTMHNLDSGNVYVQKFAAHHAVTEETLRRYPVPPPSEVQRLSGLIDRWNAEGAGQWGYALCSIADLMDIQERWDMREKGLNAPSKPKGHYPCD